ncbi:hypothetical protein [Desulfogranum japonicum]|uniref:hypothetical protein n=1 Tax=Desulfogranum japonicum TaxID=231447 RepID=UPI00041F6D9F
MIEICLIQLQKTEEDDGKRKRFSVIAVKRQNRFAGIVPAVFRFVLNVSRKTLGVSVTVPHGYVLTVVGFI